MGNSKFSETMDIKMLSLAPLRSKTFMADGERSHRYTFRTPEIKYYVKEVSCIMRMRTTFIKVLLMKNLRSPWRNDVRISYIQVPKRCCLSSN